MAGLLSLVRPILEIGNGEWGDMLVRRALGGALLGGGALGLYEWGSGGSFWSGAVRGAIYGGAIGAGWTVNDLLGEGIKTAVTSAVRSNADEIAERLPRNMAGARDMLVAKHRIGADIAEQMLNEGTAVGKAAKEAFEKLDLSTEGLLKWVRGRSGLGLWFDLAAEGVDVNDPLTWARRYADLYAGRMTGRIGTAAQAALRNAETAARAAQTTAGTAAASSAAAAASGVAPISEEDYNEAVRLMTKHLQDMTPEQRAAARTESQMLVRAINEALGNVNG